MIKRPNTMNIIEKNSIKNKFVYETEQLNFFTMEAILNLIRFSDVTIIRFTELADNWYIL